MITVDYSECISSIGCFSGQIKRRIYGTERDMKRWIVRHYSDNFLAFLGRRVGTGAGRTLSHGKNRSCALTK